MKRLLLLLLVVVVIVALLAWVTNQRMISQAAPIPGGPGEAAWLYRISLPDASVSALSPARIFPA